MNCSSGGPQWNRTAAVLEGDHFESGKFRAGSLQVRVGRADRNQNRIDCERVAGRGKRGANFGASTEQRFVMTPGARSRAGTLYGVGGFGVQMHGRFQHGMSGNTAAGAGGLKHQQTRELRGHLPEILKRFSRFEYVRDGGFVELCCKRLHRITNGFGLLPEMSIHTLLVCRYSRIASAPLSRPIPDRL